jgi:SAM-dependent methyltransferase
MKKEPTTLYDKDYFEYLLNRGKFRKFIRGFYLKDIKNFCKGKTIDFGCGVGELLKLLPSGSIGLEINPVAVNYCQSIGLDVRLYFPETDNYKLELVPKDFFSTFTMNHVLEHIEDSQKTIKILFDSSYRLGIERIVFTVPGIKGYKSDRTHQTFINKKYFADNGLLDNKYYKLIRSKYFPINSEQFSRFFTHNELRLVFEKIK